jgi:hypothetical protein
MGQLETVSHSQQTGARPNEVELELLWFEEESMYCLACPKFPFDSIY